jgi:hypothetical protein
MTARAPFLQCGVGLAESGRAPLVGDRETANLSDEVAPSRWMRKVKASIVAPVRASQITNVFSRAMPYA